MANVKEIKNKITSSINNKKITQAMEMVAVSKMRKTELTMQSGRPYIAILRKVINHVLEGHLEYKHSYLEDRIVKRVGVIIISTDKGLCGSLNSNLFKKILFKIQKFTQMNIQCNLVLFGLKSLSVFNIFGSDILSKSFNLGEFPDVLEVIKSVNVMLDYYENKKIDKVFIAYNEFQNKMLQNPKFIQLLPLFNNSMKTLKNKTWDYLYEPESKLILDILFKRYFESQVYQCILENIASEQAARMIAMNKATDNSINRIKELQLLYNKVRQANITQELLEIIAGAAAVSIN